MGEPQNLRDVTVHMIGHGHIDPTWLWRWTEGYEEVRATFRSALERMRENPHFCFTASSACFYAWFKEAEPELYAEVQERVREGRWEIAGGWWLEPDCNVPSGESFVRQGLYGLRFFEQEFGVQVRVGFNPDSFGHTGTLPQILKKLGQDYYVFMRPMAGVEMNYPRGGTFWWEAPDGSRVLTANIRESYNTMTEDELRDRLERLPDYSFHNPGQRAWLCFFGVGNHGGGPTKAAIKVIEELAQVPGGPALRFSRVIDFLEDFEATTPPESVPVIGTELQHHARGCYSTHHAVKQLNRETEHALLSAERFASMSQMLGLLPYPEAALAQAWKDLLYNQFHDILAGTSIPSSYHDTRNQVGAARHAAETILNHTFQVLAREIDTSPEGNTVVVFNPLPWPVRVPVRASEIIERTLSLPLHLVDDEGVSVPVQPVTGERVGGNAYIFQAELPALGYRCFHARSGRPVSHHLHHTLDISRTAMENDRWRLEIDPHVGCISRLYDKHHHVEVLRQGGMLVALSDANDTWSHGVSEWRVERGRFGGAALSIAESGEVLGCIRAHSHFGQSTAITEYTLYRESEIIDITLRVNWQEPYTFLKWQFDTAIADAVSTCEVAYGAQVRRATGEEEPCQQWVDLTGEINGLGYGLAVLNDGCFGYDAVGGVLRVSLLRSPAFAHHDPARYEAHRGHLLMEQGWHTFRFRLVPHAGPWQDARIVKQAWELNVPPTAHVESAHPGSQPATLSLLGTDAENVLISVLKRGEEGDAMLVRAYETEGVAVEATLYFPAHGQSYAIPFAPHEIKTLAIDTATWELREVDLLER